MYQNNTKKMHNKYYTPEAEEFYVGFEYEYEDINEGGASTSWIEGTCVVGDFEYLEKELDEGNVRIKYLDQKDIILLGFNYSPSKSKKGWVETYECKLNERIHPDQSYRYWDVYIEHHIDINRVRVYANVEGTQEIFFEGTIKNKSELKIILDRLNIHPLDHGRYVDASKHMKGRKRMTWKTIGQTLGFVPEKDHFCRTEVFTPRKKVITRAHYDDKTLILTVDIENGGPPHLCFVGKIMYEDEFKFILDRIV